MILQSPATFGSLKCIRYVAIFTTYITQYLTVSICFESNLARQPEAHRCLVYTGTYFAVRNEQLNGE